MGGCCAGRWTRRHWCRSNSIVSRQGESCEGANARDGSLIIIVRRVKCGRRRRVHCTSSQRWVRLEHHCQLADDIFARQNIRHIEKANFADNGNRPHDQITCLWIRIAWRQSELQADQGLDQRVVLKVQWPGDRSGQESERERWQEGRRIRYRQGDWSGVVQVEHLRRHRSQGTLENHHREEVGFLQAVFSFGWKNREVREELVEVGQHQTWLHPISFKEKKSTKFEQLVIWRGRNCAFFVGECKFVSLE